MRKAGLRDHHLPKQVVSTALCCLCYKRTKSVVYLLWFCVYLFIYYYYYYYYYYLLLLLFIIIIIIIIIIVIIFGTVLLTD